MYPIKIIGVEESRQLENQANEGGLSFAGMMENAGKQTAQAVRRRVEVAGKPVLVLVGPGNNGGDGLVAAHYLQEMGADVACYIWKRKAKADALLSRVEDDGISVVWADDDPDQVALRDLVARTLVIVDALLGVGVTRPIEGSLRTLLDVVRQTLEDRPEEAGLLDWAGTDPTHNRPLLVAVDCPTGLDCDTGGLDPATLPVDMTVTFAYPKAGLLHFPGAEAVGELIVADIGIPPKLAEKVQLEMATPDLVRAILPERPSFAHKGTFGRALIVAGSVNYVGAAALAGAGAARVGTGLVSLGLPLPIQSAVAAHLAEATYLLLPHDMGVLAPGAVNVLRERMDDFHALLLGPGLTQEEETVAFVHAFLGLRPAERKGHLGFVASAFDEDENRPTLPPLIIDADGLNALAVADRWWQSLPPDTVLTPHPGEMARLMGGEQTAKDVQADRWGVARQMAAMWNAVVVLKGAFTAIASPDGRLVVLPFANPGLATAGSGDVLSGAVAGLRAQGMGAFEAAVAGSYLHGLAGELARDELGDMGIVAGDLPPRLPLALRRVRREG